MRLNDTNELDGIKIGDIVQTLADKDISGNSVFKVGTICKITRIRKDALLPYMCKTSNNNYYWYRREDIEVMFRDEKTPINVQTVMNEINSAIVEMNSKAFYLYERDEQNRVINWGDIEQSLGKFKRFLYDNE